MFTYVPTIGSIKKLIPNQKVKNTFQYIKIFDISLVAGLGAIVKTYLTLGSVLLKRDTEQC